MARVFNKEPRVITLPPLFDEETRVDESNRESNRRIAAPPPLVPGITEVDNEYLIQALALVPQDDDGKPMEDYDYFKIQGKCEGHAGILVQFSKRGPLEILDENEEREPLFPDLSGMKASDAAKLVSECSDKAVLHHWFKEEDRKTVIKALKEKAGSLGLDLE